MTIFEVKAENDEGHRWTEGRFQNEEDAKKLLNELELEELPYVEFWIKKVVVN